MGIIIIIVVIDINIIIIIINIPNWKKSTISVILFFVEEIFLHGEGSLLKLQRNFA